MCYLYLIVLPAVLAWWHVFIPWASYQIRKIAGCTCAANAENVFPRRRLQRKPLVSDAGMHHGTCVTHVPWCLSGSLTRGGGENVPGIPGACAPAILRIWQEAHWNQQRAGYVTFACWSHVTFEIASGNTKCICIISLNLNVTSILSFLLENIYHYSDVIMSGMASQITSIMIVYPTVYTGADQRNHQSSASLAFVRGIRRWPANSPHKWPVTRKMFPFDHAIMFLYPRYAISLQLMSLQDKELGHQRQRHWH